MHAPIPDFMLQNKSENLPPQKIRLLAHALISLYILAHPIESIRGASYILNDNQSNRDLKL